jgi:hypothetical protein
MNTSKAMSENPRVAEELLRVAAMAAAMRVICMDNEVRLRQRCLSVTCPPQLESEIEFTGPVPFGFAFTAGHKAPFYVPSGHRFVIEHVSVSCWAEGLKIREVLLETRSPHMFRHMTVWCSSEDLAEQSLKTDVDHTFLIEGSTANTLSFSDGAGHRLLQVPPDTYVQLWGFLEPGEDATSM